MTVHCDYGWGLVRPTGVDMGPSYFSRYAEMLFVHRRHDQQLHSDGNAYLVLRILVEEADDVDKSQANAFRVSWVIFGIAKVKSKKSLAEQYYFDIKLMSISL